MVSIDIRRWANATRSSQLYYVLRLYYDRETMVLTAYIGKNNRQKAWFLEIKDDWVRESCTRSARLFVVPAVLRAFCEESFRNGTLINII